MKEEIYMVTEYYTPYKHNNCVERENVTLFENLHTAIDYIRGTYGTELSPYERRVKIALRDGCLPDYNIVSGIDGIILSVKDSCVAAWALEHGGYVYRVRLERKPILAAL